MDEGYLVMYSVCPRVTFESADYHLELKSFTICFQEKHERKERDAGWMPGECGPAAKPMAESHMYPQIQRGRSGRKTEEKRS